MRNERQNRMSKLLNQLVKFVGLSGIGWLLDFLHIQF